MKMCLTKVVFLVLTLWVRDTHSAALSDAELTRKVNYLFLSEYLSVYIHYTSTKSWRSRIFLWFVCVWGVGGWGCYLLHLHEIVEESYFYFGLSICVCVCGFGYMWVGVSGCVCGCVCVCECVCMCVFVCLFLSLL